MWVSLAICFISSTTPGNGLICTVLPSDRRTNAGSFSAKQRNVPNAISAKKKRNVFPEAVVAFECDGDVRSVHVSRKRE